MKTIIAVFLVHLTIIILSLYQIIPPPPTENATKALIGFHVLIFLIESLLAFYKFTNYYEN